MDLDPGRFAGDEPDEPGFRAGGSASAAPADSSVGSGAPLWERGARRRCPIGRVLASVAAALEAVEGPEGLADDDLAAAVVDCQRVRSRLDAVAADLTARWDGRGQWRDDGSKAAGARLERDAGISRSGANAVVATARRVRATPLVAEAWAQGRISTDHVRRLTRACTPERSDAFARSEAELVHAAEELDWAGFERAVAYFETAAEDERLDPTDPDDVAAHERRERAKLRGRLRPDGDGFKLDAYLDRVGGVVFRTEWDRRVEELFEQDWAAARAVHGDACTTDHLWRTHEQRRADALVEMARRSGACPTGAVMPRPLISVIVSADEMTGPVRQTFNGIVLSRLQVARLLTEADVESILFDEAAHQPVDITSPSRFFTGALRRAVEVRDRVCCHPTCQVEAEFCQVDHIVEVSAGGTTTVSNGRLLCPTHNRQRPGRRPHVSAHRDQGASAGDDGDPDQRHAA